MVDRDGLFRRPRRSPSRVRESVHGIPGADSSEEGWGHDTVDRIMPEVQMRILEAHRDLLQASRRDQGARNKLHRLVEGILTERRYRVTGIDRQALVRRLVQDLLGYGPITELLGDNSITEIMVNGPREIWVEHGGRLELTDHRFRDTVHLRSVLERIFAPTGRRLDMAHPWADGRLPDGSRVHAILSPLAVNGPYLTIRKFNHRMFDMQEMVSRETLTPEMADFLRQEVVRGRNILIGGAAGTGKTTLLNALSAEIPQRERVVSIEDAAELKLQHPHWLRLESRLPNPDGSGEVTMRELLRNALRMRPDRIIIGEVRGREAFELLSALTTGHSGALATVHASGPEHALKRLAHLVQLAETGIPHDVVYEQIRDVVDIVVQMARTEGNMRRIVAMAALRPESLTPLYTYAGNGQFSKGG